MRGGVLLGFSGGIDSRASVGVLRSDGYSVTALTLNTTGDQTVLDQAMKSAEELGVELIIDDVKAEFKQEIIDYFTDSYMHGATPAPCTICNPRIKWRRLDELSHKMGIDKIATGHYFRVTEFNGKRYVTRACDLSKDQSYYLWGLSQQILERVLTPMGDKVKSEVKSAMGLPQEAKESMGVCFLRGRDYREIIGHSHKGTINQGDITNVQGTVVGRHDGFPYYTIGQKRGLDIFDKQGGYCVIAIDATQNRVIVGHDSDLYHHNLIIGGCNIVDMEEVTQATDITVMIRGLGRNPQGFARITKMDGLSDKLHITLDDAAWAAARDQPVVLYRGERVVGGGFLEKYF